jgi:hypothetical protein
VYVFAPSRIRLDRCWSNNLSNASSILAVELELEELLAHDAIKRAKMLKITTKSFFIDEPPIT